MSAKSPKDPEGVENLDPQYGTPVPGPVSRKYLVYVQGLFMNSQSGRIMENHPSGKFVVCKSIACADVVVWTGGADINPQIYGSKVHQSTHFSPDRDRDDLEAIDNATDKVKIGICRGAQILNCHPNGGTLWQDVRNHSGYHQVKDYITGDTWLVNSYHHQMCRPTDKAVVVSGCAEASVKSDAERSWLRKEAKKSDPDFLDPEVIWYPDTHSLLFQGHPEFGHPETTKYFYELVDRYVLPVLEDKRRKAA